MPNHNTLFNPFQGVEFKTYEKIVNEFYNFFGIPVYYLPRSAKKTDYLFGEDVLQAYENYYELKLKLENTGGWEGDGDLFSKFGITLNDEAIFYVGKNEFYNKTGVQKPMVGDIIYIVLNNGESKFFFEIGFAKNDAIFYHLGIEVAWKITAKRIDYSHEDITLPDSESEAIEQIEDLTSTDDGLTDNDNVGTEFESIKNFSEESPFGDL